MSFCIRARVRVTDSLLTEAYLIFCRQSDDLHAKPLIPKGSERILRHSPGDGFRSQIEYFFSKAFPHSFDCRKYSRHRFPHPCRGLYEKFLFAQDRPIDCRHHIPLPFTVRERKFNLADRRISLPLPLNLESCPFLIAPGQMAEPLF